MAFLLRRNLSSVLLSSRQNNRSILTPLFHFSNQTQQRKDLPFLAQYLISSFGFSKDQALKVAADRNLAPIKTPDRPESVLGFLKDTGLTDMQIKRVISSASQLLSKSVSKTLEPWACEVINGGFTRETLIHLIRYSPTSCTCSNPIPRLKFWRNFAGSDMAFRKLIRSRLVISVDIDRVDNKLKFLKKTCGWSEEEMQNIFKKYPTILVLSEENVKTKMNFLVDKAGINSKCLVGQPALLAFSLEKRLVPRHFVLSLLKSKGLIKECDLVTVVSISEKDFIKRFIERYEKEVPDLAKVYAYCPCWEKCIINI